MQNFVWKTKCIVGYMKVADGKGSWYYCSRETPAKRLQLFNVTCRNIVGGNMLRAFGHHVATCHDVLRHVGCFWLKFETGQIFHTTYVDVA